MNVILRKPALLTLVLAPVFFFSCFGLVLAQESASETTESQEVKFTAADSFMLKGDYFPGQDKAAGVITLHDCEHDRRSYTDLGLLLAENGLHTLAIDFRGYGESISEEFSLQQIKTKTKDIVAYQGELARLNSYWDGDVLSAYHFLRSKVDRSKEVSVVAMGCSAIQAVALAEKMRIGRFVMIAPKMGYVDKERFKNLFDIPVYFIASAHDIETYQTAKELFEWNGDKRSKFQIFKGSRSGYSLLNGGRYLANDIAFWLKANTGS